MKWEDLTSVEFEKAKEVTKGVAIIPYGCLEKHGYHLPLGTDMFIANNLAIKAAEIEPALVVPIAPYGIINEAQHRAGCLSISSQLQYQLLEEVCDELARNGYHKIIILDGHGGNRNFLRYFAQSRLEKRHNYIVYIYCAHAYDPGQDAPFLELHGNMRGSGHADAKESSEICYLKPDTVHMEALDPSDKQTQETHRFDKFAYAHLFSAIGWYADHPYHIAGDPTGANAQKGKVLTDMYISNFTKAIKLVKDDDSMLDLLKEFYDLRDNPEI